MRNTLALISILVAGCASTPTNVSCTPDCAAGFHCDNGTCVADGTMSDGGGDAPMGCTPACSGATPKCNPQNHCVTCLADTDCPDGHYCKILNDSISSCVPGCMSDDRCSGKKCCSNSCVDTSADPNNCGGCAMSCTVPHAAATCSASKCATGACDYGWDDCNGNPADGCEANLHVDPANCTGCGMACQIAHGIPGCSDGCYIEACNFGYDDCNADTTDGCETPVATDPANCGACGAPCNALPNASASCVAGNCVLGTCKVGFFDCNSKPNDGCEANIFTDATNCGSCGNVCPNGLVCVNGGCTCAKCNFPNAASSCVNNVCVMGACVQGFADCNNNPNDGCEVNTGMDSNNCGGCGKVCPQNMMGCNMGVCTNQFCHDIGYMNCPNGAKQYCVNNVINGTDMTQAAAACQACNNGVACMLTMGDCAGPGYCFMTNNQQPCWGYQAGCSGAAGRVWQYGSSFTTYGMWSN